MNFNHYIWHLYKNSPDGMRAISVFENLINELKQKTFRLPLGAVAFEFGDEECQDIADWAETFISMYTEDKVTNLKEASFLFEEMAQDDFYIPVAYNDGTEENLKAENLIGMLSSLSTGVYSLYSEYFFPYLFEGQFDLFQQICKSFEIPLPDVPPKKEIGKRLFYYFELCQTLYEFRISNELTPAELGAFLYSFAPNFIKQEFGEELPHPTRVWITGGGINENGDFEYLDNVTENSTSSWHGNINTRRGDIVLMYCLAPRSYIHSIWRATGDGFDDPFFFYKSTIHIGNPIKITPVTFQELKKDPLMALNGLVRRSMQGVNGVSIKFAEYEAILNMMAQKGQDISALPKIEAVYQLPGLDEIKNERDVEVHLVEPLLLKLGYDKNDWTRQMVMRMGRGEHFYPDYAFFAQKERGTEQASMILETKYRIVTEKERFNTYCQAKSYALRLQAKVFILASMEGLWIFSLKKSKFEFENCIKFTWDKMEYPDIFSDVLQMIGKKTIERVVQ